MLPTLLLALSTGLQAPTPIEIPARLVDQDVVALVQASATHFCVENPFVETVIIRLGLLEVGPIACITLTPGARLVYPFPRGAADQMWFEVFSKTPSGITTSHKLHLPAAHANPSTTLFIHRTEHCLTAWRNEPPLTRVDPFASLAPHVPGHPPVDAPADLPPVISDKTLPPA